MKKILTLAILAVAAFSAYAQVKVNDANNISISHSGGNLELLGTVKLKDLANGSLTDSVLTVMPDGRIRMIPRSQLLAGLTSGSFIQNQNSAAQNANMWISGDIRADKIILSGASGGTALQVETQGWGVAKFATTNPENYIQVKASNGAKAAALGINNINEYYFMTEAGISGGIALYDDAGTKYTFRNGAFTAPKAIVSNAPVNPADVVRKQDLDDAVAGIDLSGYIDLTSNQIASGNKTMQRLTTDSLIFKGVAETASKYLYFGRNNFYTPTAGRTYRWHHAFGLTGTSLSLQSQANIDTGSSKIYRTALSIAGRTANFNGVLAFYGDIRAVPFNPDVNPSSQIIGGQVEARTFRLPNAVGNISRPNIGLGEYQIFRDSTTNYLVLSGGNPNNKELLLNKTNLTDHRTITLPDANLTLAGWSATPVNGSLLKYSGTAGEVTNAVAGTDYVTPTIGNTFTGIQNFTGSLHDIQLGGTGNGGAIKATLKSDPTNYYSYMTGAAFIQYGGAQRSALTAAGLNLYDADGSHGITLKAADNFTEDWIAKFQDTTGTIAYLHNIPVAGTDYVTPSNLANYITTNTNQTGLSGGKDWSGTHAWTLGGDDNTLINLSGVTVQSASTFVQVMSNYVIAQDNSIGLSAKLTPVSIDFTDNNSSNTLQLNFPSSLAANRTVALQDASGTIALTKDIPKMFNATASGDGSATTFSFAHGLDYTPTMLIASPLTADARGSAGAFPANSYWLTADATHVHVNYTTARPSGTNNLMWTILVK